MALLTPVTFSRAGLDASGGVAAGTSGDHFTNTGKEVLVVTNASGGSVNVTAVTSVQVDGQDVADNVVSCPNSKSTIIGPFPLSSYSADVIVQYASPTSITVQVLHLDPGA